jgi:hypothetical protein
VAFNFSGELQLQINAGSIRNVQSQLTTGLKGLKVGVDVVVSPSSLNSLSQLNSTVQNLSSNLRALQADAVNAGTALSGMTRGFAGFGGNASAAIQASRSLSASARESSVSMRLAGDAAEAFGQRIKQSATRFAAFVLAAGTMARVAGAIKGAASEAVEFERHMTRLSQLSAEIPSKLSAVSNEVGRVATTFGVSSLELVKAAQQMRQAGLSIKDVEGSLEALGKASLAPSFGDMSKTVQGSVAIIKQFKLEAKDLEATLGGINQVSSQFGVESADIMKAVQLAGSSFASAGGNIREFVSLFASVRSTTRESAETIGNGLRVIFGRLQRPQVIENLRQLGVELQNVQGQFVGPMEAVARLSDKMKSISTTDPRFASIAQEIGGREPRISQITALLQNQRLQQDALNASTAASASLTTSAEKAQGSLSNEMTKVKETYMELGRNFLNDKGVRTFIESSLELAKALAAILNAARPLLPLLAGMAAIRIGQNMGSIVKGVMSARRYANGGTVDARVMPGEFIFGPGQAQRIGTERLRAMNQTGLVPGEGNSDSVHTTLPAGAFVLKKRSVQQIGVERLARMSQHYATGGPVFMAGGGDPTDAQRAYRLRKGDNLTREELEDLVSRTQGSLGHLITQQGWARKDPEEALSLLNLQMYQTGRLFDPSKVNFPGVGNLTREHIASDDPMIRQALEKKFITQVMTATKAALKRDVDKVQSGGVTASDVRLSRMPSEVIDEVGGAGQASNLSSLAAEDMAADMAHFQAQTAGKPVRLGNMRAYRRRMKGLNADFPFALGGVPALEDRRPRSLVPYTDDPNVIDAEFTVRHHGSFPGIGYSGSSGEPLALGYRRGVNEANERRATQAREVATQRARAAGNRRYLDINAEIAEGRQEQTRGGLFPAGAPSPFLAATSQITGGGATQAYRLDQLGALAKQLGLNVQQFSELANEARGLSGVIEGTKRVVVRVQDGFARIVGTQAGVGGPIMNPSRGADPFRNSPLPLTQAGLANVQSSLLVGDAAGLGTFGGRRPPGGGIGLMSEERERAFIRSQNQGPRAVSGETYRVLNTQESQRRLQEEAEAMAQAPRMTTYPGLGYGLAPESWRDRLGRGVAGLAERGRAMGRSIAGWPAAIRTGFGNFRTGVSGLNERWTERMGGQAALQNRLMGAGIAGAYGSQLIDHMAGTATTDSGFGYQATKAGTGLLSGATTGATLGGMAGGAVGAAVGGVVGGLIGLTSSLKAAAEDIRQAKIGKALTDLSTNLGRLEENRGDASAIVGTQKSLQTILKESKGASYDKAFGVTKGHDQIQKDYDTFLANELQGKLGNQLPQLRSRFLGQATERFRNAGPNADARKVVEQLSSGGGMNSQMYDVLRRASGQSKEEFEKRMVGDVQKGATVQQGKEAESRLITMFGRLASAVESATYGLTNLQTQSRMLTEVFSGQLHATHVDFSRNVLANPITSNRGEYLSALGGLTGGLGPQGGHLFRSGEAASRVGSVLDEVLSNVVGKGMLTGNDSGGTTTKVIEDQLYERLGYKGEKGAPSEIQKSVQSATGQLAAMKPDDIAKQTRFDVTELSNHVMSPQINIIKTKTEEIAKVLEEQGNRLAEGLTHAAQMVNQVGQGQDNLAQLKLGGLRQRVQFWQQDVGRVHEGVNDIPLGALQRPLQERQERLVGVAGPNATNPDFIAARLAAVRGQLAGAQEAQQAAVGTKGMQSGEFAAAAERLVNLRNQAGLLSEALGHLANASERNAAVQEKLSQLQQDKEGRLGFGERYLMANEDERLRMNRGMSLVNAANNAGSVKGFAAEDQRLILETLQSLGGTKLSGANGQPIAADLKQNLVREFLGPAAMDAGNREQEKGLRGEALKNLADAAKAQEVLNAHRQAVETEFFNKLYAAHGKFLADLQTNLAGIKTPGGAVGRADGGPIPGRPRGTDTVPAWLTPGEFVVNAASARANSQLLERINGSRGASYLADGGTPGPYGRFLGRPGADVEAAKAAENPYGKFSGRTGTDGRGEALEALRRHQAKAGVRREADINAKASEDVSGEMARQAMTNPGGASAQDLLGRAIRARQAKYTVLPGFERQVEFQKNQELGIALANNYYSQQASMLASQQRIAHSGGRFFGHGRPGLDGQLNIAAAARGFGLRDENRKKQRLADPFAQQALDFGRWHFVRSPQRFAEGGAVDNIPAMLSKGEYVFSQRAVQNIGAGNVDRLHHLAKGGHVQHLAGGGAVAFAGGASFGDGGGVTGGGAGINAGGGGNFAGSLDVFNQSSRAMAQAFNAFGSHATALATALSGFPSRLTVESQGRVEVIINGTEALARMSEGLQGYVSEQIDSAIRKQFKERLPDS